MISKSTCCRCRKAIKAKDKGLCSVCWKKISTKIRSGVLERLKREKENEKG